MVRSKLVVLALVGAIWCGCTCGEVNNNQNDAGTDAGTDGDAGTDAGTDAGSDAGTDPYQHGAVTPGTFTLDPSSPGNPTGDGVDVDPANGIVLRADTSALYYMWVANHSNGTVSKFDTRTGKEIARYHSVVPRSPNGTTNAARYNVANNPSRTAIDVYGDVWVANRAATSGVLGTLTKIANNLADCPDRNGNGVIDTSQDANGNGIIDVTATTGSTREFVLPSDAANPNQYDECILFTIAVSPTTDGVKGRALAVSSVAGIETNSSGEIWFGHWQDKKMFKFDASTGQTLDVGAAGSGNSITLGWGPYGAAVDGEQRLWVLQAPGDVAADGAFKLALIDTRTGTLVSTDLGPGAAPALQGTNSFPARVQGYGIAIDDKNRVWIAGWGVSNRMYRYDHGPGLSSTRGAWTAFDLSAARGQNGTQTLGHGRGIAADTSGYIWMSAARGFTPNRAQLIAIHGDSVGGTDVTYKFFNYAGVGPVHFVDYQDADTSDSIGVGLDGDNHVWVNNYSGNIMRIHRDTGELMTRTASSDQNGNLYSYSDFTGYQLRNFTAPRGTYTRDFEGCSANTTWKTLTWNANEPPNTNVRVRVRTASSQFGLATGTASPWFETSPANIEAPVVPKSAWLRVEFELTSTDRMTTPVLQSYDLAFHCPVILE